MPITKVSGVVTKTPAANFDEFEQTGVAQATEFAIAGHDRLKQLQFDPSAVSTNVVVTLAAGASSSNVTITLPATSGTLATTAGATSSFTTMQVPNGTSPVATSSADTLTFTSTDNSVTITGNSTTDTINFAAAQQLSIGTIDSQTAAANGAVISGTSLVMQSASATRPGLVNTGTQTLAGAKTFSSAPTVPAGSVSAPSILFTGSASNSGIYTPSADHVAIASGGMKVVDVTSNSITFTAQIGITRPTTAHDFLSCYNGSTYPFFINGAVGNPNINRTDVVNLALFPSGSVFTGNSVVLNGAASTAQYSLTFPNAQGGANQYLANNGSGAFAWATPSTSVLAGTATNDSATAGNIGEYQAANSAGVNPGSSGAYTTVASVSLTAGDWDVEGVIALIPAATLAATQLDCAISKTTNAADATNAGGICSNQAFLVTGTPTNYMNTGTRRISLASTSTIYLTAALTYTVLSTTSYGTDSIILARRVR